MRVAAAYSSSAHYARVIVIDLSGLARAGLDVTDVAICEVLQIPCGSDGAYHNAVQLSSSDPSSNHQSYNQAPQRPAGEEGRDRALDGLLTGWFCREGKRLRAERGVVFLHAELDGAECAGATSGLGENGEERERVASAFCEAQ